MPDTFKFPNGGYEVKVYRKEDILKAINDNIIDKEVALELINRCEIDATNYLKHGAWASIPFMGNIRVPKFNQIAKSKEVQELIKDAKNTLNENKYILFRKQLNSDIAKHVKKERYYNYIVSSIVRRNMKLFKLISERHGDCYARFLFYCMKDFDIVD